MPKKLNSNTRYPLINERIDPGALANNAVAGVAIGDNGGENYILEWVKLSVSGGDFAADEGPFEVGIAHGAYSDTEIQEWMDLSETLKFGRADIQQLEIQNRRIRLLGTFGAGDGVTDQHVNGGRPVFQRLNWYVDESLGFKLFVANGFGSTITGGGRVEYTGKCKIRFTG